MNNKSVADKINALQEIALVFDIQKGKLALNMDQRSITYNVHSIITLVDNMRRTTRDLFVVKNKKNPMNHYLEADSLNKLFLEALKNTNIDDIKHYYPNYIFHPYLELFIKKTQVLHTNGLIKFINSPAKYFPIIEKVDIFNACVKNIRDEIKSPKFKVKLQNYLRSINKNSKELRKYIGAIFAGHPNLFCIRLDLTYKKSDNWPLDEDPKLVNRAEVGLHWKALLKFIKTKLPTNCLRGFAWKLEHSRNGLFNYHIMVFIDELSDKNCSGTFFAREIGEYWNTTATKRDGIHWNYIDKEQNGKSSGTGVISGKGGAHFQALRKAMVYMTQTNYFMKLEPTMKSRAFGKGNMPKLHITKPIKKVASKKMRSG
jgi:hypothetical protein